MSVRPRPDSDDSSSSSSTSTTSNDPLQDDDDDCPECFIGVTEDGDVTIIDPRPSTAGAPLILPDPTAPAATSISVDSTATATTNSAGETVLVQGGGGAGTSTTTVSVSTVSSSVAVPTVEGGSPFLGDAMSVRQGFVGLEVAVGLGAIVVLVGGLIL